MVRLVDNTHNGLSSPSQKEEYILDPWQEAVGVLQAYHTTGTTLVLVFPHMVVRMVGDENSQPLMESTLTPDMVGQEVGVLFTDLPDRPLVVISIDELRQQLRPS